MPTEGRGSGEYYPRAAGAGTPALQRSEEFVSEVAENATPAPGVYKPSTSAPKCRTEPFTFVEGVNYLGKLFHEYFGETEEHPTNFLYFDKTCLPFLIPSAALSNKRDCMLNYIKNIMFLEMFHEQGKPFLNTIPVIGYTSITGKSDMDFLVRALGIFRATGAGQGGIGFVDSTIDTYLPEAIRGTNASEVKRAKEKLQTVLRTLPINPQRATVEQITFNEIFKIAHITETVFLIVFLDLYCRIQYIENQILTRARSMNLLQASRVVVSPSESTEEKRDARITLQRGTNDAEKEGDATYDKLKTDILNYLCTSVNILHEEPNHPVNANIGEEEYYKYNLNLQLPKYEFDDTRETIQTTARFQKKDFFRKTCELMKALFGFTFDGEDIDVPNLHFNNIRLDKTNSSIVFTTKKSKITEYFEDFRELDADGQRRSEPKSFTYVPKEYTISKFGKRLVTLSKTEGINITRFAAAFKPFILEAFGLESKEEARKMLQFYFKSWDNPYKKSELLLTSAESYLEKKEQRSGFLYLSKTITYTVGSAPARAHMYNIDLYTQYFSNKLIPRTIIPQLQESDVLYAKLAAYAYDLKAKETVQYKDRIAYYINIWNYKAPRRSLSDKPPREPLPNIRTLAVLKDTFLVGIHKDKYAFSPYDFMDSLGVENIRFYYEKPFGFDDILKTFGQRMEKIASTKEVRALEEEKAKKEASLQRKKAEITELKREIPTQEAKVLRIGKVQRSQNLGTKLESLQSKQDELEVELRNIGTELTRVRRGADKKIREREEKALVKKQDSLQEQIREVETKIDEAVERDNALEQAVKQQKLDNEEILNKLKAKLKVVENDVAFLEKNLPTVERKLGEAKEDAEKEIKNEFVEYVKAKPFKLIIAYRGTDFKGQEMRDLLTADILLSVGKEESDPRFTIVNRIRANMRIFYKLVREEVLKELPEILKELFKKNMRLVVYATGHSLGGTLAIVSTYASYKTALPEYMRGLVSPIILSVGFNSGMGPRIAEKMYNLPANSFRLYSSEGDAISLCARYFKSKFVNSKNIISTPCIHALSYEPQYIIMNHGMTNFLGITEFCKDAGIAEITEESIAGLRSEDSIQIYGKGVDTASPQRVADKDIPQKITISPAASYVEGERAKLERIPKSGGAYRTTRRNRVRNGTRKH
jgi:hypothetical protein